MSDVISPSGIYIKEQWCHFGRGNERYYPVTGLSSVEAYNIKSNEWFHVAPMNTRRSSVGVGVVGGRSGSFNGEHCGCSGL